MTRRLLTLLWLGLLLVCCNKPDPSVARKSHTASAPRGADGSRGARRSEPESIAALRMNLTTAATIECPATREKEIAAVAWEALDMDPSLASEAFQQLPTDSPEKIRLIQHYAMRHAEQNPEEALEWAASVGSAAEIAAAKCHIALVMAETDPQRAANLLAESGISGREFDVALVQILQRWAAQSPPDAAAWVVLFPPGAAREAGITLIAERWLSRDAPSAFDWLASLQDADLRNETSRAIEGIILQQPKDIRAKWLEHVDAQILGELEQQREPAMRDIGDNVPIAAP